MKRILLVVCSFVVLACVSCVSSTKPTQKPVNIKNENIDVSQESAKSAKIDEKVTVSKSIVDEAIEFEADSSWLPDKIILLASDRYLMISFATGKCLEILGVALTDDKFNIIFSIESDILEKGTIDNQICANKDSVFLSLLGTNRSTDSRFNNSFKIDIITGKSTSITEIPYSDVSIVFELTWESLQIAPESIMKSDEISSKTGVKPHEPKQYEEGGSKESKLTLEKKGDYNLCLRVNTVHGPDAPFVSMDFLGIYQASTFKKIWTYENYFSKVVCYSNKLVILYNDDENELLLFDIRNGNVVAEFKEAFYCGIDNELCFVGNRSGSGSIVKAINLKKLMEKLQ